MILSFSCGRQRALTAALALLLLPACARPPAEPAPEPRAGVSELMGILKLVRQEYGNAVAPAGGEVIDQVEYDETQLFAEQADAKFAALRAGGQVRDESRAQAITGGIARVRADVERKAPPAAVVAAVDETLGTVQDLLAGTVPEAIRGTVLATTRADQALGAEVVVGDYRIGVTSGPPRPIFRRADGRPVEAPTARGAYVGVTLRERRTKRFLPGATVDLELGGTGERMQRRLVELWGDFHQYGADIVLPDDGPVTVTVSISPPAYGRHGDMLARYVEPATVRLEGVIRGGTLTFDAHPIEAVDPDYAVGDDILVALAETGGLHDAGPYRLGVVVEGPEPYWIWKDGKPALEPVPEHATNHVEVVLLDRETGQLVPDAGVRLTFLAEDEAVGAATLQPLLSVFSHYGVTLVLPARTTAVRVHVDPPALDSLDHPRLVEAAEIQLPLPQRRGPAA
jgi:hypothetical protein